ncbi:unnamed protein product, partial [Brassica rapa]
MWAVCSVHKGRLWVSVSTHRTSVAVCDVRGCPSVHISARWSLDSARWPFPWTVRVIFAHVGCLFSTHRTSVGVRQHTQDVRGCPCVSVNTHRTSVVVHQYTYQHVGRPWVSASTHRTSVAVSDTHKTSCGCPCVSVCVRVCRQHTGCPWVSVSTHGTSVCVRKHIQDVCGCLCVRSLIYRNAVLGLRTLAFPVDCSGDFCPCGLSVQYTKDVCGCPSAHTGRPWPSVCVRQHTQDVRGCPSVHISARWSLDSARWPFPWTVRVIFAHVGCLFSIHRTSVGVRQHTQDVRGCPCVSVNTHRTSVAV